MNDAFWLLAKAEAKERIGEADAARLRRHAALAEPAEPNAASAPPAINLQFAALQSWLLSLVRN